MLYQELPRIHSTPLDRWGRLLVPALVAGAALTAAILLLLFGQPLFAAAAVFAGLGAGTFAYFKPAELAPDAPLVAGPDYSLVGAALELSREPTALTSGEGSLLIVNTSYRERFGSSRPPLDLGRDQQAAEGLQL